MMASSRRRSAGMRLMEIPVRMYQTRMHGDQSESPAGLLCQVETTSARRHVANRMMRGLSSPMIEATHTGIWMSAMFAVAYLGILAVVLLPAFLPNVFR